MRPTSTAGDTVGKSDHDNVYQRLTKIKSSESGQNRSNLKEDLGLQYQLFESKTYLKLTLQNLTTDNFVSLSQLLIKKKLVYIV